MPVARQLDLLCQHMKLLHNKVQFLMVKDSILFLTVMYCVISALSSSHLKRVNCYSMQHPLTVIVLCSAYWSQLQS